MQNSDTQPLHIKTPTIESQPLAKLLNKPVYLKMECYQPTGSFKIRGLGKLCQEYLAQGKRQLVSTSGGNAGYSAAFIGRKLGMQVTVFVPETTHELFRQRIRNQQAKLIVAGKVWDETNQIAQDYLATHDAAYVPPFDHPTIWAGHASMIDEIASTGIKPGGVIVAVGGGGLLCGVLTGMHRNGWHDVPTFAIETEGAASFAAAQAAGKLVTLNSINTIATSLGAKRITEQLLHWNKRHSITSILVSDRQATDACYHFANDHRVLVEPACGAALSACYTNNSALQQLESILVIVCGGIGVSLELIQQWHNT